MSHEHVVVRGHGDIGTHDHAVGAARAQDEVAVGAPDRVADADRPGGQRGQQRLHLAVVRGTGAVGEEHVLVRPQVERARQHVRRQEPRPQLTRADEVPVVTARPHGRDRAGRDGLQHVGGCRHAPLQGDAARRRRSIDTLLPRARTAGLGAQAAHAEEALDEPVVLERLDAPCLGLVEPALVEVAARRVGAVAVDPALELADVRRARREVPAVGDERRITQRCSQRCDALGNHVVARLPAHETGGRHLPLVGVEGTQDLVRVPPRVELHRAERDAAPAQVVDRGRERRWRVVVFLRAVPVRRPVVGPVRHAPSQLVRFG